MSNTPKSKLTELRNDVNEDLELLKEYRGLVLKAEQVQQRLMKRHTEHCKTLKAISGTEAKSPSANPDSLTYSKNASTKESTLLMRDLREVGSIRPSTGSLFVRLFLGRVNVREVLARDRDRLREEYDKFKYRTNFIFLVIPLFWIVSVLDATKYIGVEISYTHWIPTLTHIWLLYYYVSLSLRENILRVNGSRIMAWWIYHHYVSAVMSVIVLTWPDSPTFRGMTPMLTLYFSYQAIVQFVQTWYQRKRHYALRALGRAGRMDPTTTEGLSEFHPGLWVVVVLVVLAYCFQLVLSYLLMRTALFELNMIQPWYKYTEEVQCVGLALCFAILGVVNFMALIQTLRRKRKRQLTTSKLANISDRPQRPISPGSVVSPGSIDDGPASIERRQMLQQKYRISPFFTASISDNNTTDKAQTIRQRRENHNVNSTQATDTSNPATSKLATSTKDD